MPTSESTRSSQPVTHSVMLPVVAPVMVPESLKALLPQPIPVPLPPVQELKEQELQQQQQQVQQLDRKRAPAWKTLLSGGIAGAISRTTTAPLERLKILFQLASMQGPGQRYNGMWDAIRTISREEGVSALWKGNGTNILRIAPYSAIGFFCFDSFFKMLTEGHDDNLAWRRVLAGGCAGACAASATYPLDLVRTRLTLQGAGEHKYNGIGHALRSITRTEGFLALYKGAGTTLVGIIPYNAINFATFDSVQAFVRGDAPKLTHIQALWVGAFSGAVAATATYPLDLLRRRMQMRSELGGPKIYTGLWDATKKIFRSEGPRGFFRGLIPCYLKVVPSNAIGFAVYDVCKKIFQFESGSAPSGG